MRFPGKRLISNTKLISAFSIQLKQPSKISTRGRFGQFGEKKGSCHRKDVRLSLFIVNSSVTAICMFSSSFRVLLNYSYIKPRGINRIVNETKLQDALTPGFGILRTEYI